MFSIIFSVFGFLVMLALLYLGFSFGTLTAEKSAIKLFLEKPVTKKTDAKPYSGCWLFVFWPFNKLVTWPKQQQQIDLPKQMIISAKKEINGSIYSQAYIEVDPVFYFHWATDSISDLVESYKKAPGAYNEEALKQFLGDFITAIVRNILGRISWYETRQGQYFDKIKGESFSLNKLICDELEKESADNPIFQARLKSVRLEFKSVKLPEKLESAISAPQIAEYEGTAIKKLADAESYKREKEGLGDAEARKHIYTVVQDIGTDGIQMETLRTLEKMAQGESSTIFYGLPPQVSNILKKHGGYEPSEQEMGKFAAILIEALKKKDILKGGA